MQNFYVTALTKNTSEVFAKVINMPDTYDWKFDAVNQSNAFPKLREKVCELQQSALYTSTRALWQNPNDIVILNCQPV